MVDAVTKSPLQNARVFITADTGGGLSQGTVLVDKLTTNSLGVVEVLRSYSQDQPFEGTVRLSSTSPYYVAQSLVGTVDAVNGVSLTIQMIPDE